MTRQEGKPIREMMLDEVIFEVSNYVEWERDEEIYMFRLAVSSADFWPPARRIERAYEAFDKILLEGLRSLCVRIEGLETRWVSECRRLTDRFPFAIGLVPRESFFTPLSHTPPGGRPRDIRPIERWPERLEALRETRIRVDLEDQELRWTLGEPYTWISRGIPSKQDWSPRYRRRGSGPGSRPPVSER